MTGGWVYLDEVGVEVSDEGAGVWAGFAVFFLNPMFRVGGGRFFVWWLGIFIRVGNKGDDGRL